MAAPIPVPCPVPLPTDATTVADDVDEDGPPDPVGPAPPAVEVDVLEDDVSGAILTL